MRLSEKPGVTECLFANRGAEWNSDPLDIAEVELAMAAMVARNAASFSILSAFGAQHVLYTTRLTPGPAWL